MYRFLLISLTTATLCFASTGCMSRAIKEGLGVATGASGKVVEVQKVTDLSKYKGFRIESLSAAPGLKMPSEVPALIRQHFDEAAGKRGLSASGTPSLKLSGEIIHFESSGVVDTAIGPLEEVIVRTRLMDGESGQLLTEANLIGRAKSTTAGGAENLSKGAAKALNSWLKECGLKADEDDEKE